MSEQPLFSVRNRWFAASVGATLAIAILAALAGLIWLPLAQPDLKLSGIWDAICSAAGVPRAAPEQPSLQPAFKTSTVVMTSAMPRRSDPVSIGRGATLAQRWRCAVPRQSAPVSPDRSTGRSSRHEGESMYVRPQKTSPPRDSSRPPEPTRPEPAKKASTSLLAAQARRRRYRILPPG